MPTLVKLVGKYSNENVNKNVISYCFKSKYISFYGGRAVFMGSIDSIAEQFKNVQDAYCRNKRPIEQFVLSFNDSSSRDFAMNDVYVNIIARAISCYIGERFQNIYAVHTGSENRDFNIEHLIYGPTVNLENLHVHFVVNRVSYKDGSMFYGNKQDYWNILNYAKEVTPVILNSEIYKDIKWSGPIYEETYYRLKI